MPKQKKKNNKKLGVFGGVTNRIMIFFKLFVWIWENLDRWLW